MKINNTLYLQILFLLIFKIQHVNSNEVDFNEKLAEYIDNEVSLVNESGDTINLLEEINLPTILSFVYYNCPGSCSPLMEEISSIIDKSDLELGKDYQIFTISFDPKENTQLAVEKKNNFLREMQKKEAAEKWWRFFTADSQNIAKITNNVGFKYMAVENEFIHKTGIIIIDRDGKIIRYFHGIEFLPLEIKMSVVEAEKNNPLPTAYKRNEYCYPFTVDAYKGLHKFAKVFGIIILSFAILLFLTLIIKPELIKK